MANNEISYKRPNTINVLSTISKYYKATVLEDVRETLLLKGGDELLHRWLSGCFGHFTGWNPGQMCAMVVHHVVSREINYPYAEPDDLWFHINGHNLRFSYPEFALVTGLHFGTSDFRPSQQHDLAGVDVFETFCRGRQITIADLWNRFKKRPLADHSVEIYLRVAHVLVLYVLLLGYELKKYVADWVWKLVDDLEAFSRFPWGAYVYLNLKHYFKNMKTTPKYHFYGAAWAFHAWSLEVLPDLGRAAGKLVAPHARPRCVRWQFRSRATMELEPLFSLQLVPDYEEGQSSYGLSTTYANPLAVDFVVPRNALREGEQFAPEQMHRHRNEAVSYEQEAPRTSRAHRAEASYAEQVDSDDEQERRPRRAGKRLRQKKW